MIKRKVLVAFLACLTLASLGGCRRSTAEERAHAAKQYLATRPDLQSDFRSAIERGQVMLGMAPDEAAAAGGGCFSEVQQDPKVWPQSGTDPWRVLAAQRLHPDDSKITLSFRNTTQFGTNTPVPFSVVFVRGRAARVERASPN
jgi:hypothetical protein